MEWREQIIYVLNEWRRDGLMCDITLCAQDDTSYPVHSCMLAASCPFFRNLLCEGTVLSKNNAASVLKLDLIRDGRTLAYFLEFLYTGEIITRGIDAKCLGELQYLANHFDVAELTEMLKSFREEDGDNFYDIEPSTNSSPVTIQTECFNEEITEDFQVSNEKCNQTRTDSKPTINIYVTNEVCHPSDYIPQEESTINHAMDKQIEVDTKFELENITAAKYQSSYPAIPSSADIHQPNGVLMKTFCSNSNADQTMKVTTELHATSDTKEELETKQKKRAPPKVYECKICDLKLISRSALKKHVIGHGEKYYNCQFCFEKFYTPQELKIHRSLHVQQKPFSCKPCQRSFHLKRSFLLHQVSKHNYVSLDIQHILHKCVICQKVFTSRQLLEHHEMRCGIYRNSFQCFSCGQEFTFCSDLKIHLQLIHHDKTVKTYVKSSSHIYKCRLCTYISAFPSRLRQHYQSQHAKIKRFACTHPGCLYKAYYKCALEKHILKHNKNGRFADKLGTGKQVNEQPLHMFNANDHSDNNEEENSEYSVMCDLCGWLCTNTTELKLHLIDKHPFGALEISSTICTVCHQHFSCASSLQNHIATFHSKEFRFRCTLCSYTCYFACFVQRHFRLHHHDLPMPSNEEFQDVAKQQLTDTTMVNNTKKRHSCQFCGRSFAAACRLKDHITVKHNKTTRFKCTVCLYSSYYLCLIKNHFRKMHPEHQLPADDDFSQLTAAEKKPVAAATTCCFLCELPFNSVEDFKNHIKQSHCVAAKFTCLHCKFRCCYHEELQSHFTKTHPDKQCPSAESEVFSISFHQVTKRKKQMDLFVCSACKQSFLYQCRLEKHLSLKHSEQVRFKCPSCSYKAFFLSWVKNHFVSNHKDKALPLDHTFFQM